MRVILNGRLIEKEGHKYLKEILDFPEYYGENLDALYDCLTDIGINMEIILDNDKLVDKEIIDTFIDASNENPYIIFKIG